MEKQIDTWSVETLRERYPQIDFPEYQREPNLWSLTEKQRLIDSMVRRFDIAPLYLYQDESGSIDCVDGRQRIGTIMSFVGSNERDNDANFRFRILNEIYDEENPYFKALDGKTFEDIQNVQEYPNVTVAQQFVEHILQYQLTVVMLSDSRRSEEFNLQFTRLNLGAIINSGEKLHAMVGDLRDTCFGYFGQHPFLQGTNIPTRRFAREQVGAQILAQVFALEESESFTRTRHIDLQRLFKLKSNLDETQRQTIDRVSSLLDYLDAAFKELSVLRNRAITVSTVLLAWEREVATQEEANEVAAFIDEFVHRLSWQVKKGLLVDPEYRYLTDFQRHVTQASAEGSSVDARAQTLEEEFERWRQLHELRGDAEWKEQHPGLDPSEESRL